jgi:hypothetical protein
MKVRTLRMKNGFKEFAMFDEEGNLCTSETPQLLPPTATMEGLKKYHEQMDIEDIDYDTLEIVEFDLIESEVIGADIRNKLSSSKGLVSLLEIFFKEPFEPRSDLDRMKQNDLIRLIKKEMNQSKDSIKYLSKLIE